MRDAVIKEHHSYKYKTTGRADGQYDFEVWVPGDDLRAPPSWSGTANTEDGAERRVKGWIDDLQPRPREEGIRDAIKRIYQQFCSHGADAILTREQLRVGLPEAVFAGAMRRLRGPLDDQDLYIAYAGSRDRFHLGLSWRTDCEDGKQEPEIDDQTSID